MKMHYAGEIAWLGGHVLPGWAACCSGDKTVAIRERGNHTYERSEVTCKACLKMLDKHDIFARLQANRFPQSPAGKAMREQVSWIPASKPPPEDEHVLVFFEAGGLSGFAVAYYDSRKGWFELHGDKCHLADAAPSHWMPLPDEPLIPQEQSNA